MARGNGKETKRQRRKRKWNHTIIFGGCQLSGYVEIVELMLHERFLCFFSSSVFVAIAPAAHIYNVLDVVTFIHDGWNISFFVGLL